MRISRAQGAGSVRRAGLLVTCALGFAGAGSSATALAAGPGQVRVGGAPPVASAARDIGGLAAATRMHVTILLKGRQAAELAAYARGVSTPGSPLYRAYLTPSQFAQRFGAVPGRIKAVQASLRAHGLSVGRV